MIEKWIKKVTHLLDVEENGAGGESLQTATAVLFLELAYADFELTPDEEGKMRNSLKSFFQMDDEALDNLLTMARAKREQRNDIWLFTDMIKRNWSRDTKLKVLKMLWQLVYADGHMDMREEALMRKLTSLLGLSHGDMIMARRAAREEEGQDPPG